MRPSLNKAIASSDVLCVFWRHNINRDVTVPSSCFKGLSKRRRHYHHLQVVLDRHLLLPKVPARVPALEQFIATERFSQDQPWAIQRKTKSMYVTFCNCNGHRRPLGCVPIENHCFELLCWSPMNLIETILARSGIQAYVHHTSDVFPLMGRRRRLIEKVRDVFRRAF
jgi:hypothetical protein